jgi:alkylhydroperoxidase family enzyme
MRSMNQEERLVKEHGHVTDNDLTKIRKAGFSDGAIAEVIANVALNIFTNYFNLVAEPRVDFPIVPSLAEPQG